LLHETVVNNYAYLGLVRRDRFMPLDSEDPAAVGPCRLTGVAVGDSADPASAEMPLAAYEGSALLVRGFFVDGWIRSAIVVEQAGPILSAVVARSFAAGTQRAP
jgi:hypothetical protein